MNNPEKAKFHEWAYMGNNQLVKNNQFFIVLEQTDLYHRWIMSMHNYGYTNEMLNELFSYVINDHMVLNANKDYVCQGLGLDKLDFLYPEIKDWFRENNTRKGNEYFLDAITDMTIVILKEFIITCYGKGYLYSTNNDKEGYRFNTKARKLEKKTGFYYRTFFLTPYFYEINKNNFIVLFFNN